jgi:hypothetical protein
MEILRAGAHLALLIALAAAPSAALASPSCKALWSRLVVAPAADWLARAPLKPSAYQSYSTGKRAGTLRVMTLEDFKAQIDTISPDSIVVLDRLPGELDPPFVAGIITSHPLPSFGSHVQEMFRAIEAPLAYVPGAFDSPLFRNLNGTRVVVETGETAGTEGPGTLYIRQGRLAELATNRSIDGPSILPPNADRNPLQVIPWQKAQDYPELLTGQKFVPLALLRANTPAQNTPEIAAITTGAWESFKRFHLPPHFKSSLGDRKKKTIKSLEELIEANINAALKTKDETVVQQLLDEIRRGIDATPMSSAIFIRTAEGSHQEILIPQYLQNELRKQFGSISGTFSFRSSNEVEDFLGAGVYTSVFGRIEQVDEMERMLKQVWTSLYSYRAFQLRRHFGLREKNTSVSIMVHPYLSGEEMNGIATYAPGGDFLLELNAIRGAERATNPSATAMGLKTYVKAGEDIKFSEAFSAEEREALMGMVVLMRRGHQLMSQRRGDSAVALKLEWNLHRNDRGELSPVILQMKEAIDVAQRRKILYGLKENLRLDGSVSKAAHPIFKEFESGSIPTYHLSEFVRRALDGKKASFPIRVFQLPDGELAPTAWKSMARPHWRTSAMARQISKNHGAKEVYYGYMKIDQVKGAGKSIIDRVAFLGGGGASSSGPHLPEREGLSMILATLMQFPDSTLTEQTIVSVSSLSGLKGVPDMTLSELRRRAAPIGVLD